ncbi:Arc family DNA-binding protein [Rhizobium lentis]|uniref:Arc family DNA-binding protein n=1 Tax=Rhizobium lentis TaxID=1138194 RepID=UPI001C8379EA|nr:Arc family DNA-binding protein [Rhizobium lentis]MBX5008158.1 Arc family DNA-binding protein [Rhizobium lentis]
MSKKPGRGSDQFPLRLPPGMRDQIKRAAEENDRSMNSEILDALREIFPEEPSLEELVDEVDYTLAILEDIKANSRSGDITRSNKFQSVLGRFQSFNEELWKIASDERQSPVVKLDRDVLEGVSRISKEWELASGPLDESLVNNLIRMSINRIERGEENLKIWIRDGESMRVIELESPERRTQEPS